MDGVSVSHLHIRCLVTQQLWSEASTLLEIYLVIDDNKKKVMGNWRYARVGKKIECLIAVLSCVIDLEGKHLTFPNGGSSVFGQKPVFGSFGSSTTQTNPFGGATQQQSQPAFGSSLFGSSAQFGTSSQPAFGTSSTPTFGSTSTPAFGAASSPAFGVISTPAFGSTGTAFGVSNASVFGSGGAFGASSTPVLGSSSTPGFGAASTSAFGASSAPSFSFGSSPAFGQSISSFGSSPFSSSTSHFGAPSSSFGAQATTPTFGSAGFGQAALGGQRGGSRVAAYTPTAELDSGSGTQPAGKLGSISAMPVYKDKSHEELRWEDYQLGDKGGPAPAGQSTGAIGFGATNTQLNPFASSSAFGQPSANPFSSSTPSNPFAQKIPAFGSTGFGSSSPAFGSSPFGASSTSNPFGSTLSGTTSIFGTSGPAFGANTSSSPFGSANSSAFGTSTSIFGSASAPGTASAFGSGLSFANTQSSPLFQSTTPSLGTNSLFGQTATSFGQNAQACGQSSLFNTPSTGFGGSLFSSTPSLLSTSNPMGFGQTTPSLSTPFQSVQPGQTTGSLGFGNFGQTQPGGAGGFGGGMSSIFGQNTFGQLPATQSSAVAQQLPVNNPFGTLPAIPQMSIGRSGTAPSIHYGISSLPVVDKPAPVRLSSLLTSRHISQRRIRLPARKYHPRNDGPKVPFFSDDEEQPSTPKADALFIPRENPRALVIRPLEQWPPRKSSDKSSLFRDISTPTYENGKIAEAGSTSLNGSSAKDKNKDLIANGSVVQERSHPDQKTNGINGDHSNVQKEDSYTGHRAGESAAAIVPDIEALMPKLRNSDYYTEPQIQQLSAMERARPGFCCHVKDFVVGRHGYGSIRFIGETDVRCLDLESIVQFNNREVIVYMDESKKPPVGQGLNKPAEVTLLNIKCIDKKTGNQYTDRSKIDRYREMLKRKAEDQGAEFVFYDHVKGEWKFKVNHFSKYRLTED